MIEVVSKNAKDTQKLARIFAKEIQGVKTHRALVVALEGNLGAGKTTFTQGFMKAFGVKENVLSPTFVLMKVYKVFLKKKNLFFKHIVHIDCYGMESADELTHLDFKKLLQDPDAIILIEWADRIKKVLPKDTVWLKFLHGKKLHERLITIPS